MDKDKRFDVGGIQPQFNELLLTVSNKLQREFPTKFGQYDSAQLIFMLRFRIAINTYDAILFLCADIPKDAHRSPKFALAVPPMVRTLYEEFIAVIFLLHDTPKYIDYLYKTDYNEKKKELAFAKKYHLGKLAWDKYIQELEAALKTLEKQYGLTETQFKKIGGYPTPGNMIDRLIKDFPGSNILPFLEFSKTWMYRHLSLQSHLDVKGFQNKGIHFSKRLAESILGKNHKDQLKEHINKYRSEQLFTTYTLLLAIMSEMNRAFGFGLSTRLIYIWELFSEYTDITKDFYETRYRDLLK